ncbi:hypothetical protein FACS1894140_2690 [Spirochaetia bacterium]|nr:hypothetical protein FACS1894140_2690 [Spirochaetia bacterium]
MTATKERQEEPLTFEKVWEMFQENSRELKESSREFDRRIKETDRELKERSREFDRLIKESNRSMEESKKLVDRVTKNVGGLNRSMGELIETLIAAKLWEKFDAYPYNLKRAYQRMPIFDETNRVRTDIDIMLTNGDYVMAVEVKASLHRKDDVDDHLRRMELILKYPPEQCIGKILLGALAGGIVQPEIRDRAHQAGLFVLELTGESVHLAEPPAGFSPRQW